MRMEIVNFDIDNFNKLKNTKWMLGNNILYKMCKDYPKHTNPDEIRAKIWLIGRSYAASIERRAKKNKKHINDDFYDYVVKKFIKFKKKKDFDRKLEKLKNRKFDEDTLKEIILLHYELTKFFKSVTRKEKRSLASKYLHFHVPIFPIYDSRANNSIKKIIKGKIAKLVGDQEYSKFCYKILSLYNHIKSYNRKENKVLTLREIDTFLVEIANDRDRSSKSNLSKDKDG